MNKKKKLKEKKIEKCIECGEKTKNYYTSSINSGKIIRCWRCHELNILRSVRCDTKIHEREPAQE